MSGIGWDLPTVGSMGDDSCDRELSLEKCRRCSLTLSAPVMRFIYWPLFRQRRHRFGRDGGFDLLVRTFVVMPDSFLERSDASSDTISRRHIFPLFKPRYEVYFSER